MRTTGRHHTPRGLSPLRRSARALLAAGAAAAVTAATMTPASAQNADFSALSSGGAGIISEIIQTADLGNVFQSGVARPANGTFTSGFGPRWGTMHEGIDIANAIGTPIYSVMPGTVINSGPASGYGQWIRIQHDDGSMSVYGHMETLNVSVGQRVSAGQHIAGMGNRGFSTGSHLHFEIHPAGSGPVDPVIWFANRGIHF